MSSNDRDKSHGNMAFAVTIIVVVVVWGWLLPILATTKTVRSRDRWLDENQIDPAAMFYTDLPLPKLVVDRER